MNKSEINGIGLFAAEFIPKGTLIWKFVPGFDFVLKKKDFNELSEIGKSFILRYGYYDENEDGYVVCVDDARFFNHSITSNSLSMYSDEGLLMTKTITDIKEGEEITDDYSTFVKGFKGYWE